MEQNQVLLDRASSLSHVVISSLVASSVNVASFVPEKLHWIPGISKTNYDTWKVQMLCLIRSQGLMDFMDLNICPPFGPGVDPDAWDRNNTLVKGWILGSITDQMATTVLDLSDPNITAAKIWETLKDKFDIEAQDTVSDHDNDTKKRVNESTPLHKAALEGNSEEAEKIIAQNPGATKDWIDGFNHWRLLHIAVGTGKKAVRFVNNLVQQLSDEELENLKDVSGATALHKAAAVDNTEAAKILVLKNKNLCYIENNEGLLPIHMAALYAKKDVLKYLIKNTKDVDDACPPIEPYTGFKGQQLVNFLIQAQFFDILLQLADKRPHILQVPLNNIKSPLKLLVTKLNALSPINYFTSRDHFFYSVIMPSQTALISPSATSDWSDHFVDSLIHNENRRHEPTVMSKFQRYMRWRFIGVVAPELYKNMMELRNCRKDARELLRRMCKEIGSQDFNEAAGIFKDAIFKAAELDVREVVEVVVDTFPGVIYSLEKPSGQHIFHKAIENRSLEVFDLINNMSDHRNFFTSYLEDSFDNNPLHSAGKLAPSHKLNETSGAALQMQRELQWFVGVQNIVHPYSKEQKNSDEKTPRMVFTEEHKVLKKDGEDWMRGTANSFALVAVLISTVMITGAITVPGGNSDDKGKKGKPNFIEEAAFMVFAASDAISLFASITSLLLFLAILTSRYAEDDFLYSLPTKLICGLATLFLSIISMMVSFIVTLYLVFGKKKHWVIFPLLISACMPVASFVLCQFPLLRVLMRSTYGRGIFYQKSKRSFY